jgi:cation:H+ antiporter
MYWLISLARREHTCTPKKSGCDPLPDEYAESIPTDMSMGSAMFWVVAGLLILLLSSRLLLWGAINVAQSFGVPDLIIGLTIVAIGTSLPELAASITSVFKGEDDIAIGNVLGSNMFNLLAVLGLPGLIHPLATPADVLTRDYPIMVVFTLLLFALAYGYNGTRRIGRVAGGVLLTGFFAYLGLLFHANSM